MSDSDSSYGEYAEDETFEQMMDRMESRDTRDEEGSDGPAALCYDSTYAANITGQDICCDGGIMAMGGWNDNIGYKSCAPPAPPWRLRRPAAERPWAQGAPAPDPAAAQAVPAVRAPHQPWRGCAG